jgi:hypothetical protein
MPHAKDTVIINCPVSFISLVYFYLDNPSKQKNIYQGHALNFFQDTCLPESNLKMCLQTYFYVFKTVIIDHRQAFTKEEKLLKNTIFFINGWYTGFEFFQETQRPQMSVFPHAIALNQYLEQMFLSKLIKCNKICCMKLIIH